MFHVERLIFWSIRCCEGENSMPKYMKGKKKVHKIMGEFKRGTLRSSSGAKVRKRSQAVAIAMSEAGMSRKKRGRS